MNHRRPAPLVTTCHRDRLADMGHLIVRPAIGEAGLLYTWFTSDAASYRVSA